jgi:hypothetical protein
MPPLPAPAVPGIGSGGFGAAPPSTAAQRPRALRTKRAAAPPLAEAYDDGEQHDAQATGVGRRARDDGGGDDDDGGRRDDRRNNGDRRVPHHAGVPSSSVSSSSSSSSRRSDVDVRRWRRSQREA